MPTPRDSHSYKYDVHTKHGLNASEANLLMPSLLSAIAEIYEPEEIYPEEVLQKWAKENGFVTEEEAQRREDAAADEAKSPF